MSWFKNRKSSSRSIRRRRSDRGNRRAMRLESLEDRKLLATVVLEESSFDPQLFMDNVSGLMDYNVVGYGVAAHYQGQAVEATGGLDGPDGGWARTEADGAPVAFTADTRTEIASVSKIITTAAVLHVLENQTPDLDAALSTPIAQYLPSDWIMGPNVGQITVRHLLTHTSGFPEVTNAIGVDFNSFGNNNFQNLRNLVAAGVPDLPDTPLQLPNGQPAWAREYNNANFSLLARMIPYMAGGNQELLDNTSATANDPGVNAGAVFGSIYKAYVQDNILGPAGIVGADLDVTDPTPALAYNFPTATVNPGMGQANQTTNGGAFGWKLSAPEVTAFLHSLHDGGLISSNARDLMNAPDFLLGWAPGSDLSALNDAFGNYYQHGGSASGAAGAFRSTAAVLPGNVKAALLMNNDDNTDNVNLSRFQILRQSYQGAWTDLVIQGDPANNTFELRLNADPNFLDLVVDDVLIFSNPVANLQSLELRGLGGSDTFLIEDLPQHIDLALVGGEGNDFFDFGNPGGTATFTHVLGNVAVLGGEGYDDLDIEDANGFSTDYTMTAVENHEILTNMTIDASSYPAGKLFQLGGVEEMEIRASLHDNQIVIDGLAEGISLRVRAGLGDDHFVVADVENQAMVWLHGGQGNDTAQVSHTAAQSLVKFQGDEDDLPGNNDTLTVGKGDLSTVEGQVEFNGGTGADLLVLDDQLAGAGRQFEYELGQITGNGGFGSVSHSTSVEDVVMRGGAFSDAFAVETLDFRTDLEIFGNGGDDTFRFANKTHDLDAIAGYVTVHGEGGFPQGQDSGPSVGADQVFVYDDQNDWSGRFELETLFAGLHGRMRKLDQLDEIRFQLTYDQIEETTLRADDGPNKIDVFAMPQQNVLTVHGEGGNDLIHVESTPALTAPMRIFGDAGSDTIRIAPTAENLGLIQTAVMVDGGSGPVGASDHLEVLDTWSGNVADYHLSDSELSRAGSGAVKYASFESLAVGLSLADNHLDIVSTAPGTTVMVLAYDGHDTLTASNLASDVHFWGGGGDDSVKWIGTAGDDEVVVEGNSLRFEAGSLTSAAEQRTVEGGLGRDLMTFLGVDGSDELFHIRPSTQPFAGQVQITGQLPLDYLGVEDMAVVGNAADNDSLRFDGRTSPLAIWGGDYADRFDINLAASGSESDPVMRLRDANTGDTYLTLRDYQNVGAAEVRGLHGADRFNVQVDGSGATNRQLHLDGGTEPVGSRDALDIVFAQLGASSCWQRTTKEDGSVDVDYGPLMFDIDYEDMEWNSVRAV